MKTETECYYNKISHMRLLFSHKNYHNTPNQQHHQNQITNYQPAEKLDMLEIGVNAATVVVAVVVTLSES